MQVVNLINPKRIFHKNKNKKKDRSVSRSDQSSFSSSGSSSSSEDNNSTQKTPTSVLPGSSGDHWPSFDLVQAFKLIDRDNDGLIPTSELSALLSRIGAEPVSQEELAILQVELADEEAEGCVSLEALASRLGPACEPAGDEELRETFKFFDSDLDGKITAEELLRVFREAIGDEGCTLEDCRRMIKEVDRNGEGFVCFEDFTRMMFIQT